MLFSEEATAEGRFRELMDLLFQLINNSLEQARGRFICWNWYYAIVVYNTFAFNDIEKISIRFGRLERVEA